MEGVKRKVQNRPWQITEKDFPFRHWQLDDFVPYQLAGAAATAFPPPVHRSWVRYHNDCEKGKWACNDLEVLGDSWRRLFDHMSSDQFVGWLKDLTGYRGELKPDLYGGGCHLSFPGSELRPHLDYSVQPKSGMQRLLNVVLYLNLTWNIDWGGATEFCDLLGNPVVSVAPAFNRAAVWVSSDVAVHGTEPMTASADTRVTAAMYYVCPPLPDCPSRRRALFMPRRT